MLQNQEGLTSDTFCLVETMVTQQTHTLAGWLCHAATITTISSAELAAHTADHFHFAVTLAFALVVMAGR